MNANLKKAQLLKICGSWKLNPYEPYVSLSKEEKRETLLLDLEEWIQEAKAFILSHAFLIALKSADFDSSVTGIPIGKLSMAICEEPKKAEDSLMSIINSCDYEMIFCKIDSRDQLSLSILKKAGFQVVDTQVTFLYERGLSDLKYRKVLFKVREVKEEDRDKVLEISKEAFRSYPSRYWRDVKLRPFSTKVYEIWVNNLIDSAIEKREAKMLVAEKKSVVAFFGYPFNANMHKITGKYHGVHGLSGVSKEGKGAYVSLCLKDPQVGVREDTLEYDTTLENKEVIRIWNKLGFRHIRTSILLHKWLK